MRKIYLCGGINGLSDADAKDWRAEARKGLIDGWDVLDPMSRDYRGQEATNAAAIVEGDLLDIGNCRALLVKADRPSWGTAMEVFYAFRSNKRVILFGIEPGKMSPWLAYHCEKSFPTLAGAVEYLMRDVDPMYGPPRDQV